MSQSKHSFSDTALTEGLGTADDAVLQLIYKDIRPGVLRAVVAEGADASDGGVFFQAALVDTAELIRSGAMPEGVPLYTVLEEMTIGHFKAWLRDENAKNTTPPEAEEAGSGAPFDTAQEVLNHWVPGSEHMAETRKHLYTWKKMDELRPSCTTELLRSGGESDSICRAELATALGQPSTDTTLPAWVQAALNRQTDHQIWSKMRQYEQNLDKGLTIGGQELPQSDNTIMRYAFVFLLFATVGYVLYAWINAPKPAGEIFKENFEPPQSLLADINRRFKNDTSGIIRPEQCAELLQEADAFYAAKNYTGTKDMLLRILQQESLGACHSDACFGLGLVFLKQNEPGDALQYFSKIDNVEAYGEDLYWYQALCFVQITKINANARPLALRAVERFLENTNDEVRKKQAEKMLLELK